MWNKRKNDFLPTLVLTQRNFSVWIFAQRKKKFCQLPVCRWEEHPEQREGPTDIFQQRHYATLVYSVWANCSLDSPLLWNGQCNNTTLPSSGGLYRFWKTLSKNGIWGSREEKSNHNIHSLAFISSQTKDYISRRSPVKATFVNGIKYHTKVLILPVCQV